jgi:hypothetical protein
MRTFSALAAMSLAACGVWAQQGGGGNAKPVVKPAPIRIQSATPYRTYGSPTGFGSILWPGMGTPPPINPYNTPSTFVERFGASIMGYPGYNGAPAHGHGYGYGGGNNAVAYPVPYPVYMGGYDNSYAPAQQQAPNITIIMPPQSQQPPVTINQYGVGYQPPDQQAASGQPESNVRTYESPSRAPSPAPADDAVFLVALKDSTVYTAVAYWVEGDMLHYITTQGKHNQVSLDLVDRAISDKLNEGRKVEFRLPPAK